MNYFLALILPPVACAMVVRDHRVLQTALSVVLFVGAIASLWAADSGGMVTGYAAGPVLYVLSVIHAFVHMHRHFQSERNSVHPHRDSTN